MKIEFVIPGEPVGKQRPKFSRRGNGVCTYTPEKTVNYENLVKLEYEQQCGEKIFEKDVPICMTIDAIFSVPKSASKKKANEMLNGQIRPTKKPDVDNIIKIIADSLNKIAYYDDSQIASCAVKKRYGSQPCVTVSISNYNDCKQEEGNY